MNLQLDNQVVFVAGSSRGIGRAIAEALLAEGASVVLTGRDAPSLRAARARLENAENSARLLAIAGDLSDPTVIAAAFAQAVAHFGRIDHLVANLGTGAGDAGSSVAEAEWHRLFDQNFFASMRLAQTVLPHLGVNPHGGSILFIASIAGVEALPAPLPYSAAKAALLNYSKNLARRLGMQRIRVNSIAPGNICFPGGTWQKRRDADAAGVEAMLDTDVPQRRFGTAEEVASMAAYLCSSRAAFCTGGCYVVDGGQTRGV